MNPFDLGGPAFLAFYGVFAAAVHLATFLFLRAREDGPPPKDLLTDPYAIAHLRGGATEALRVATLSLIDRGLLVVEGKKIRQRDAQAGGLLGHAIEKAVFAAFARPAAFDVVDSAERRALVVGRHEALMTKRRLMPDAHDQQRRAAVVVVAGVVLAGVAAIKLVVALQRRHFNLLFLIIMALVVTLALARHLSRPRTRIGDRAVGAIKSLFLGLRVRAPTFRRGETPVEVLMVAAAFGVAAVPLHVFRHRDLLVRDARPAKDSGSCGASCGSSCGGGGCGGGCGGCGG